MTEAVRISETSVHCKRLHGGTSQEATILSFYQLHGETSQKTVISPSAQLHGCLEIYDTPQVHQRVHKS
jgi:hypothetical protein